MRLIGRRELSSLEPFDLVLLIVLGDAIQQGDRIRISGLVEGLRAGTAVQGADGTNGRSFRLTYDLSSRQREILLEGGGIRYLRNRSARS